MERNSTAANFSASVLERSSSKGVRGGGGSAVADLEVQELVGKVDDLANRQSRTAAAVEEQGQTLESLTKDVAKILSILSARQS